MMVEFTDENGDRWPAFITGVLGGEHRAVHLTVLDTRDDAGARRRMNVPFCENDAQKYTWRSAQRIVDEAEAALAPPEAAPETGAPVPDATGA